MDYSDFGYGQQLNLDAIKNRKEIRSIFDKYYNDPVKQLDELIRFANQLHADLGYRGKSGEAIFSGEVFGSDTYGEGWILDDE